VECCNEQNMSVCLFRFMYISRTICETSPNFLCMLPVSMFRASSGGTVFIDHVAGEIIRLVASVCVCVSVCLSVCALLFEPFDL